MKPIGGYFELELNKEGEYHNRRVLRLNSGRYAFEYILRAKNYRKVYLPYYTCDVMLEPINRLKLEYEFYHIDTTFRPVFDYSQIRAQEVFVYNNYYGICDKQVAEISQKCKSSIIDNSQAFFSEPLTDIDTFYSARKFFGLPDGAYLYTNKELNTKLEQDISYQRFEHLLGRIDIGPEQFYKFSKENDKKLSEGKIKTMSNLTFRLLNSINYNKVAATRIENFSYLNDRLNKLNKISIDLHEHVVPMLYPFVVENGNLLRKYLQDNKIFTPIYWPNVNKWITKEEKWEKQLYNQMIALPIDQRYSSKDMETISKLIEEW